jgi:hypothetical protein
MSVFSCSIAAVLSFERKNLLRLSPTAKRRLVTAHTQNGHSQPDHIRLRFFSASAKSLYVRFAPPSNGSAPVKRSQKSGLSARGTVIVAPG